MGVVLLQDVAVEERDGVRQPIVCASMTLSVKEVRPNPYELGCLAVLFCTEKFRKSTEHHAFNLETDKRRCLGFCHIHGTWGSKISALKFQVRHIRGTLSVVAHILSIACDSSSSPDAHNQVSCHLAVTAFPLAFHEFGQL
jgi:hypothetical protein